MSDISLNMLYNLAIIKYQQLSPRIHLFSIFILVEFSISHCLPKLWFLFRNVHKNTLEISKCFDNDKQIVFAYSNANP